MRTVASRWALTRLERPVARMRISARAARSSAGTRNGDGRIDNISGGGIRHLWFNIRGCEVIDLIQ